MHTNRVENYWRTTKYRLPDDPLVKGFVASKINIVRRYIDLCDKSMLDVGCGNGTFMHYLASLPGCKVSGIDMSEAMLSKNTMGDLVRGTADSLPFREKSFDLVFEANILHHADDPEKILREMHRVAKKYVVLIEPNRCNPVMFLFSLLNRIERGGLRSSKKYIRNLVNRASLRLIYITSQGLITQNNTPSCLIPFLKLFEREAFYGAYIVAILKK